ncbi:hypothetical protein L484_024923 [Morus notabilis]|uniref:Uncharacterized protein n=1 Tax=Morus notabilis TaxID=981085 RepID=W9R3I2_9ROSA|nr:hypothetical protein L484_024923 [Morus notabilis]
MESASNQILDRFKKKRPHVDLSFLDESDEDEVEVAEPSDGVDPADQGEQMLRGGDALGSRDAGNGVE